MKSQKLLFPGLLLILTILINLSVVSISAQDLCEPGYSTGCAEGDGFTDFAVGEIQNYGSGCANLNGTGWSQYLSLGPALFIPGESYDFTMQSDYSNQNVSIWIDFNDDFDLTADEMILFDFELSQSGQFYTTEVEIPIDAIEGQHYMRARTNWSGSCDDPCEDYTYGEAEDYFCIVGEGTFGDMEGFVTHLTGGDPVENAEITLTGAYSGYETTSGSEGHYSLENVLAGQYQVEVLKSGYNLIMDTVTIIDDSLLIKNYELTQPTIDLSVQNLMVTLSQNQNDEDYVTITNNGDGELNWSASPAIQSKAAKDYLDLQFEYPTSGSTGEAGIESDGEFLYTAIWTGNQILKYDTDGNFVESFSIPGVSALRDLAYDGTYFYGSAGIPVLFEMDFQNQELISTINTPENIRAIAYNDNQDIFYSGNWSDQITVFDKSGTLLGSFFTGPVGSVYYGLAYDNASPGGPFLWGYGAAEGSQNVIVQMQLPAGNETGFYLDLEEVLEPPVFSGAGGLFTQPNLLIGKWTLGGLVQNHSLWGLELGDAQTWLGISPNGGTLQPGENQELTVSFDASDLEAGIYNANILFNSFPDVGSPDVDIEMTVIESAFYLCDLLAEVNCTDVQLDWNMCPAGAPDPDSFNIYRNDVLIATVYSKNFTDNLLFPDSNYTYDVTWFMDGIEYPPTSSEVLNIPVPPDLEPFGLVFTGSGNDFILSWNKPQGCLIPDGYNVYENGSLLDFTTDTAYMLSVTGQEYYITAVYYFGESEPSNSVLITGLKETVPLFISVFPNPADNILYITSDPAFNTIRLLNSEGKTIYGYFHMVRSLSIDISGFERGVYLLAIECREKVIWKKVLIQ